MRFPLTTLCGILLIPVLALDSAQAGSLLYDFGRARDNDPTYAAAIADNETARIEARLAGMAYYPRAQASATQLSDENEPRQTISLTQPIVDANRWFQLKEKKPRLRVAEANLENSEQELARSLFEAVGAYVVAREKQALNRATIEALQGELDSAEERYDRGVGTITDVYDTRLRVAQAKAESFANESALQAARRQYAAIVGEPPLAGDYALTPSVDPIRLESIEDMLTRAVAANPQLRSSRVAVELADLNRKRTWASYIPSVNARAQQSWYDGDSNSSSGVILEIDVPLDAGQVFSGRTSELEAVRARDQLRATEQQVTLQVQQLHAAVIDAQARLETLQGAIEMAELSVEATQRSFEGGLRTKIDLVNAILALDQARSDSVSALIDLGSSWLQLQLLIAVPVTDALGTVQAHLFGEQG